MVQRYDYRLRDAETVASPALLVYPELIQQNIATVVAAAGGPHRLRPHVKTHKTLAIARLLLEAGVTAHKCATLAEAELLAQAGAADVLIAYPLVGPNLPRLARLIAAYPHTQFATLIDHPQATQSLAATMQAAGRTVGVWLDLNVGQNRTGITPGEEALELYALAARLPGLRLCGFHAYDGHNNPPAAAEREAAARRILATVLELRQMAERRGLPVPQLVCGGTPPFLSYAARTDIPGLQCSPGTFVLYDAGYGNKYEDLQALVPAAVLLGRVISRPTPQRVTLDLGTKAVAADPPLERRLQLFDWPPYRLVAHNEEHCVVECDAAVAFRPGDLVYALPAHICPTVALYPELLAVIDGRVVERWPVVARDRYLSWERSAVG